MEEKYPIKFSLSQFILLLAVEIVVLSLVFLLGARFGKTIFPEAVPQVAANQHSYQELAPPSVRVAKAPQHDKLVDSEGAVDSEANQDANADAGNSPNSADNIPTYRVGADGSTRPAARAEQPPSEEKLGVNKSLFNSSADKNTMVRFKSSGNSKFTIQIGEFFDEVLASREITKLKQKGYEAYLVIDQRGGTPSFDVRVGSFGDRRLAEDFASKMSNEQNIELRVVQAD